MVNAYVSSVEKNITQEKDMAARCQLFTRADHKKPDTLRNSLQLEDLERNTRYAKKGLLERFHRDLKS